MHIHRPSLLFSLLVFSLVSLTQAQEDVPCDVNTVQAICTDSTFFQICGVRKEGSDQTFFSVKQPCGEGTVCSSDGQGSIACLGKDESSMGTSAEGSSSPLPPMNPTGQSSPPSSSENDGPSDPDSDE